MRKGSWRVEGSSSGAVPGCVAVEVAGLMRRGKWRVVPGGMRFPRRVRPWRRWAVVYRSRAGRTGPPQAMFARQVEAVSWCRTVNGVDHRGRARPEM